MQNHQPFDLYLADGTAVQVKNHYDSPASELAAHLVTDDGRVVHCQDEQLGVFWFDDTHEKLYLDPPREN